MNYPQLEAFKTLKAFKHTSEKPPNIFFKLKKKQSHLKFPGRDHAEVETEADGPGGREGDEEGDVYDGFLEGILPRGVQV